MIARAGQDAPGPDVLFRRFEYGTPASTTLVHTASTATLGGDGVDRSNDMAIYVEGLDGTLLLIAREGDAIDVSDTPGLPDMRTISLLGFVGGSGNEDGRSSGFSEEGQVAFYAAFTDGTQGIFVSDIAVVPEPSGTVLIALALGVLGCRQSRSV